MRSTQWFVLTLVTGVAAASSIPAVAAGTSSPVFGEAVVAGQPSMHEFEPFVPRRAGARPEGASISADVVSLASAQKAHRLLRRAVIDADVAYRAVGRLEIQAYSLPGYDLLQMVQALSTGDAYNCGKHVESVRDDIAAGIRQYKGGNTAQAQATWRVSQRRHLPRLRTWVMRYRADAVLLAADVNDAVMAGDSPWVANPAIQEAIDDALSVLESRLRQVRKVLR
jgi:hypothetical protein